MPWEETGGYIRSGHRSPEEFQPDSLRTIVLSEEEGVKAVVGKPKGEDVMEIQSYLFDRSKGWTLEKAKAWFEKHRESETVREHVSAIVPFKVLEKIVDKPLRIRGVAITAGMSRNFNIYAPEELQAFANKLVSAPVYIEHVAVPNAVGKIVKTEWDGQNLWYEAEVYDEETAEKIRKGLIKHVSVGADYDTIDILDGKIPHGLHNAELSLVAVPGIPETSIQVLEKLQAREQQVFEPIISGEYILGFYQDTAEFLPEHFSTVWLDKENGILAIVGKLRAEPEAKRVQSIFFAKEKMWDENKIRDWLLMHPHYMAPAGVSAFMQTSLKECEEMGEKKLVERVWTRRYINDLPDFAFAVILPGGEKDEDGKTVPRSLRKFPYRNAQGKIDLPHLRNANARILQSGIPEEYRKQAMLVLGRVKKRLGIGMSDEEAKIVEQTEEGEDEAEGISFEVEEESTMDEVIMSVEDVVGQIGEAIEALTVRVGKLEKFLAEKPQDGGGVTEGLLKNPKQVVPVKNVVKMIQDVLPSPMVERSWGFGPQRLCQELRGVVLRLRGRVKQNGR